MKIVGDPTLSLLPFRFMSGLISQNPKQTGMNIQTYTSEMKHLARQNPSLSLANSLLLRGSASMGVVREDTDVRGGSGTRRQYY